MEARIVVIDNEESLRELFTACLSAEGCDVLSYEYAQIDSSSLKLLHPDLIILDFNQQDSGAGWEFLQILKMDDATAHIPILMTSITHYLPAEILGYLLARNIQVIYKPFDIDPFLRLVERTLTLASQADGLFSSDRVLPILLVEDTVDLREEFATILGFEGYAVVTASNGQLALDAVYSAELCLILLDIAMPIMDGFEF